MQSLAVTPFTCGRFCSIYFGAWLLFGCAFLWNLRQTELSSSWKQKLNICIARQQYIPAGTNSLYSLKGCLPAVQVKLEPTASNSSTSNNNQPQVNETHRSSINVQLGSSSDCMVLFCEGHLFPPLLIAPCSKVQVWMHCRDKGKITRGKRRKYGLQMNNKLQSTLNHWRGTINTSYSFDSCLGLCG